MKTMAWMKKKSAILYHYPCPDGVVAALAAHLYFSATSNPVIFFPNTVYSPLRIEQLPLNEIGDLYLLDFVGPSGFVQEISSKVDRVVILDHHKTAFEQLGNDASIDGNVIKVIDVKRSGATIAFDYFKEKLIRSLDNDYGKAEVDSKCRSVLWEFERVQPLFEYIEDGDLWKWSRQNSKAFSSGFKDLNIEYDVRLNPSLFDQLLALDLDFLISQGMVSLSHKQRLIDDVLSQSYEIALGGGAYGRCMAVNADSVSELRSELGHQLAAKSQNLELRGIGAVVYRVPELGNDQLLKISLRSVKDEDTTAISQGFGGGGHQNASSFMLNSAEFERWKV
ncbi:DHHA1 domain protein [Quillaja saponaria]|uniref:DHHA1 domain protein n=1 Tax=Quillaja saponaria TaxID=32244 RepID=A0AAD7Q5L3_QUISA|nr:DHHA1 domain protein [Quillaja saponaria]